MLVHSFISCDGAAYHLQEDVNKVTNYSAQADNSAGDTQTKSSPSAEIHAHQHCHCDSHSTFSYSISPEQSKASLPVRYSGLSYPPAVPPPIYIS